MREQAMTGTAPARPGDSSPITMLSPTTLNQKTMTPKKTMIQQTHLMMAAAATATLLCGAPALANNLLVNGDFGSGNLDGWTVVANTPTTITYDAASGSALLHRNDSTAVSNGNYLYQTVPVVIGRQYKISAQWKGDLLRADLDGTGRNWSEVIVNFTETAPAPFTPQAQTLFYKKRTDGSINDIPMPWDWQNIVDSPNTETTIIPPPTDGIFTATAEFMTIAFNLGGRAQTSNNAQPGFFYVDNVSVIPWPRITATSIVGGTNFKIDGINGPPLGGYEVRRSNQLSTSPNEWEVVGDELFDSEGNFSFTTPMTADPSNFYSLRVLPPAE